MNKQQASNKQACTSYFRIVRSAVAKIRAQIVLKMAERPRTAPGGPQMGAYGARCGHRRTLLGTFRRHHWACFASKQKERPYLRPDGVNRNSEFPFAPSNPPIFVVSTPQNSPNTRLRPTGPF